MLLPRTVSVAWPPDLLHQRGGGEESEQAVCTPAVSQCLARLFVHMQYPSPTGTGCTEGCLHICGIQRHRVVERAHCRLQHYAMASPACLYSHLPCSRSAAWWHRRTCLNACHDSELRRAGVPVHAPAVSLQCCVARAYLFACVLCPAPLYGNVSTPVLMPAEKLNSNIWWCKLTCLHFWSPSSSIACTCLPCPSTAM